MRTASEIDAAKAVLNATDLTVVTSEVRQYPPGYVTGGRLKLNTNLQIEVAPIAINIAGRDVVISETTIIGNEHWTAGGVATPRVSGSWYYLYLGPDARFAVSPNAPEYNTLYFAHYHPAISDLRAIGKFYFGNDGTVLYVQASLETTSAQVLVASTTYTGEDANYYCKGADDQLLIVAATKYLSEAHGGGEVNFSEGIFIWGDPNKTYNVADNRQNINLSYLTYRGKGYSTLFKGYGGNWGYFGWYIEGTVSSYLEKTTIQNINFEDLLLYCGYVEKSIFDSLYIQGVFAAFVFSTRECIIQNIISDGAGEDPITIYGSRNIVSHNVCKNTISTSTGLYIGGEYHIVEGNILQDNYNHGMGVGGDHCILKNNVCINNGRKYYDNDSITQYRGIHIYSSSQNILIGNLSRDNGNLIDRSTCENSSTSPMIFGESAPTASNCTWGFTSTGPYSGTGQYRFTKTAAAGTIAYLHLVDNVGAADVHGLIPGTQYEWSGWLKVAASASCGFQGFRVYQATTAAGAASAVAWTTATTGWQEVRVTATVYVNATTAYIGLVASASLGAMSFDVDNLRLFPPGTTNVHNQNYYNGGTQTYDGL